MDSNLDYIITIGDNTIYTDKYLEENNYKNKYHFKNYKESYKLLDNLLETDDIVLFKASNAMGFKNIVNHLLEIDK